MNELSGFEQMMLWGVVGVAFISLIYAYWLWRVTDREDKGNAKMQEVWNAIRLGAEGYLKKQLKTKLYEVSYFCYTRNY